METSAAGQLMKTARTPGVIQDMSDESWLSLKISNYIFES